MCGKNSSSPALDKTRVYVVGAVFFTGVTVASLPCLCDSDKENNDEEKEAQGSDTDYSEDGEEANGKKQSTRGRGRGRGRGGRSGNGKVLPVTTGGRRGRPCKS
ncbi:unnamed protein product [Brassica rapa]|uniref:Transmembrane protein n=1 Tax=Brassica campestris TaxID=3711 RepID=A0A8D9H9K6_BRACM|nr:unnamed protein product [Brassica rapa]